MQDSTDGPELDVHGHLIQVPKSLTNGAEVVYDRATNLFIESECDYDSDEDEDSGLCEELMNAGQCGNYSTTGLTRNCEHADPPAEVLPHTEVPDADKASPAPPGVPACDGIELTSPPKSITSLGSAPRGQTCHQRRGGAGGAPVSNCQGCMEVTPCACLEGLQELGAQAGPRGPNPKP